MRLSVNKVYLQPLKHIYLWLALSFIIFIGWQHASDLKLALKSLSKLSGEIGLACLSLAILSYALRSLRWLGYMRLIEQAATIKRHVLIYLAGFAFTASPAKAGELMRATYLYDLGVPFRYTLLSFVSERLFDVIIVLMLGSYFLSHRLNVAFGLLSVAMLLLPFMITIVFTLLCHQMKNKWWFESTQILTYLWQKTLVVKNLLLTLLAWSAQGAILWLMLNNFEIEISIAMAISIYCLSLLIGAASLIPSGIGATEVGMVWLLTQVGVASDIAITASLLTRMLTLWPAMLIGLLSSWLLKARSDVRPV